MPSASRNAESRLRAQAGLASEPRNAVAEKVPTLLKKRRRLVPDMAQNLVPKCSEKKILVAGYSILDAGYSILDAGYWMLDTRYSYAQAGFSQLTTQSFPDIGYVIKKN